VPREKVSSQRRRQGSQKEWAGFQRRRLGSNGVQDKEGWILRKETVPWMLIFHCAAEVNQPRNAA